MYYNRPLIPPPAEMQLRFCRLLDKCYSRRDLTRLWNWVDSIGDGPDADIDYDCEWYWAAMLTQKPYYFTDPTNPNTAKFAY